MKRVKNRFSKRECLFLECAIFCILLLAGYIFRYVIYTQASWWPEDLGKTYFLNAQVAMEPFTYQNETILSIPYMFFLHQVCLMFGNVFQTCLLAHALLYMLGVFVWYFAIRKATNWIVSLFSTAIWLLAPFGILFSLVLNPFVLWFFALGVVSFFFVSIIKALLKMKKKSDASLPHITESEPVVTVVKFEEQEAVEVPNMTQTDEKPLIFIPKTFETPKRVAKPKVDFAVEVPEEQLCFDLDISEQTDFDIP